MTSPLALTDPSDFESELRRLIAASSMSPQTPPVDVQRLREATSAYLADIRDDNGRDGTPDTSPHCNLVMLDAAPTEVAVFVITVFRPSALIAYVGSGQPRDVISLSDRFTLAEVDELLEAFDAAYGISSRALALPRSAAEYWLRA